MSARIRTHYFDSRFVYFAASLAVSPFSLISSITPASIYRAIALYSEDPLGHGHIFLDFHCLQVLDPEKANFVSKHVS